MPEQQLDLLIVGAGPVGLTLGCEALRHGLSVRIIDFKDAASVHSKAQIVHARTLEMLEDMGLAERFIDKGIPIHSFNIFSQGGKKRIVQMVVAVENSKYQNILSISQHDTEVLLGQRLVELGGTIERRVRLRHFSQDGDRVTATLVHEGDGDREETISVPWMVGCDGAHSTVRKSLGLSFEGQRYPMHIIQTDARVDFPFPTHEDEVIGFLAPGTVVGLFPLPGGESRYRFLIPRNHDDDIEPTLQHFQDVLDRVAPPGTIVSDPRWMVGFRIHCRMVPRYRVGRIFVAGDAGHIHSPAGGQGMNLGMQDAYNLAWKLALFHRGEGTETLLDSYSAERHPVAAETLAWTDTATNGALVNLGLENSLLIEARNRLAGFVTSFGFVQQRAARMMSMLDIAYTSSPICGEARGNLLKTNVLCSTENENPSIPTWTAFSSGPQPGQRAPDVSVDPTEHTALRLHSLLHGTTHTLLLFDGQAATPAGYDNLAQIADQIARVHGAHIRTHIIVPASARPDALEFDGSVILDPMSSLHNAYAAHSECLYLIRPDGYIGFRSQPATLEPLLDYLKTILV